ncbi:MAG: DUF4351 domain-containing protein, partial [bacterium]|nr:DUF4351 domain-containing protein [bacterium]
LPGELGAYQPEFRYLLIDEGSLSKERLEAMRNLAALLFRLETSAGAADAAAGLVALNEQLAARGTPEVELAFDLWLEQVLVPRFPEVNVGAIRGQEGKAMLAQSLDKWIGDARQEGRQEGRQQGRREGQKELLLGQLEQRFAPLPDRVIRRVRAMRSKARLTELAKKVLEAESLAELGLG